MTKAIFLDRDDTINYDPGFLKEPEDVKLFPHVAEGIRKLREELGFKIIVISNQSGITRGILTEEDVNKVNNKINQILSTYSTRIDAFYYCPYHPDFDSIEKCECRKPSPKMVFDAANEYEIDLTKSFFIGDRISDIECGINANLKTIFIINPNSNDELNKLNSAEFDPDFIARDFRDVVKIIKNISD